VAVKKVFYEDVDCIHITQDRNQWRVLLSTVMKFRIQ